MQSSSAELREKGQIGAQAPIWPSVELADVRSVMRYIRCVSYCCLSSLIVLSKACLYW